jgi:hypothetical protein
MDYKMIVSELQQASMFDLFRLQAAITRLLDDPARLTAIKHQLREGTDITYFSERENRLVPARILEIRKTRTLVQDLETSKRWTLPLYMINIAQVDTDITPPHRGLDRLSLRLGESVGFAARDGRERFGTVVKLNPKRAKIETEEGVWSVPYSMLFHVIEGQPGQGRTITLSAPDQGPAEATQTDPFHTDDR